MQWRMDDGPVIFVSAQGLCEFNERVIEAGEAGVPTDFEDQYYRTLMCMESGDGRYGWVNRAVFVTEGRISPGSTGRGIAAGVFAVI